MRRRYRPTRKELQGSHLLHLTSVEVGSGQFSTGLINSINLCLNSGTDLKTIAGIIDRTPEEINSELKRSENESV